MFQLKQIFSGQEIIIGHYVIVKDQAEDIVLS